MSTRSATTVSVLAVITVFLSLAASMWRYWNWAVLSAVINAKIVPLVPQIEATERGVLTLFGVSGSALLALAVLACALVVLAARRFHPADRFFWVWLLPCVLMMLLAVFSSAWSIAPGHTRTQVLPFLCVTTAALILGLTSRESEILTALEVFSIAVILASLFALFRYPEGATMVLSKVLSWRGIFVYKNYLGLAMALANVVFLIKLLEFRNRNWLLFFVRLAFYALSLLMLFKANARTSLIALLALYLLLGLGFAFLRWGGRLNRTHGIVLASAGLVSLVIIWFERRPILGLVGRSSELSGRLPLWERLSAYIADRPALGYGFGQAFWRKYSRDIAFGPPRAVARGRGWHPGQAHNMFVEFTLMLGLVGLALLLVLVVETLVLGLRYYLRAQSVRSLWPLLLLALVVLVGVAESFIAANTFFLWTLLVLAFGFVVGAGPGSPALSRPIANPPEQSN